MCIRDRGLTWMAPGLLGFGLILHLSRALYALHRGRVAVTATASGWFVMAVAAVVLVPLLVGGGADQVATLQGLGGANSIGMTVAGVGLVVGIVRSAGRAAVDGLARTGAALVVASVAGAWLGRWCVNALDASDLAGAVLSGVLGAAVCGVVVGGLMWLFDRSVVRTLRGRPGPADAADVAADVVGLGSPESRDGDATTVGYSKSPWQSAQADPPGGRTSRPGTSSLPGASPPLSALSLIHISEPTRLGMIS